MNKHNTHNILIVEDENSLRRLMSYRLGKEFNVRAASNGEEALEEVKKQIPDLIISDIMMPKMDGYALHAALQSNQETQAIPFVFLTAKADRLSRTKGAESGADLYITKPFDIETLFQQVHKLLGE